MAMMFTVLVIAVMLVNGWTDAPNAISTCVTTRSLTPKGALCLAGICNFAGTLAMSYINSGVAKTMYLMVDFGDDHTSALSALCAGMTAVVLWSVTAWIFGIPTSESHALISGITGAAIAQRMSFSAINFEQWRLVLLGLFLSTLPAFLTAKIIYAVMRHLFANADRRRTMRYFMRAQCWSAGSSAFMHGAQDSQKFMGVFMLGMSLLNGNSPAEGAELKLPLYVVAVSASVMTLGTMLGGFRIIKKVGSDMVRLDASGGTVADISSSGVSAVCSFFGIPVSTTHSKACSMMGVGSSNGNFDRRVAGQLFFAWILTFPICGALGFIAALIMC